MASKTENDLKVLYISYDGLTDPLGQSQILPYLFGLEHKGYHFTVISFEKKQRFTEGEKTIRKLLSKRHIDWQPKVYHKKPPVLSTLYDLHQMKQTARRIVKANDIQLVHCRSYIAGLVGLWLKRKFGISFLFDIRGFWADERVDGGLWDLSNPIYKRVYDYFKDREAKMMAGADHIISLTHIGKEEIVGGRLFGKRKVRIEEDKITVIPCAVDLDLFDPERIDQNRLDQLRKDLGIKKNDKIMIYLGSIGTWYLLEEMLAFFNDWLKSDPDYKFLFVTKDNHEPIKGKAKQIGIDGDHLKLTSSHREDVPYHIALADIGLFFIKNSYSKKASSATKMGEFLAMGLPIVTNKGVGDADYLMENKEIGNLVDLKQYDAASIYAGMGDLNKQGGDSIRLAQDYFSLEVGISRYSRVYDLIFSGRFKR